jgi:L-2-hydroxyglutarate oxidase LhgO
MERIECVVIGAGVIGLALARQLALSGREVIVLESEDRIGTGTSSRNSEVIHAGIYYAEGSLKARLCVEGNQALYAYCRERGIDHRRCGKLIVATEESQIAILCQIQGKARANGAEALRWITAKEAAVLEPRLHCVAALLSPSTGIVDSHGLMKSLLQEAESRGAVLVLRSPLLGGRKFSGGLELEVGGSDPMRIQADHVFNCAGLHAHEVARSMEGIHLDAIPPVYYAKGNYYGLSGAAPFSRLVYPVPEPAGLGVHMTLDLAGQARFGPDVEWVEGIDYAVDPGRAEAFYAEIRRYWPELGDGTLQPAYSGIRPKLQGPKDTTKDFLIQGADDHGVPGLVTLLGIESPGLTACLALAKYVVGHSE